MPSFGELRSVVADRNVRLIRRCLKDDFLRPELPMDVKDTAIMYCVRSLPHDVLFQALSHSMMWIVGGTCYDHRARSSNFGFLDVIEKISSVEPYSIQGQPKLVIAIQDKPDGEAIGLAKVEADELEKLMEVVVYPHRLKAFNERVPCSLNEKQKVWAIANNRLLWATNPSFSDVLSSYQDALHGVQKNLYELSAISHNEFFPPITLLHDSPHIVALALAREGVLARLHNEASALKREANKRAKTFTLSLFELLIKRS